MNRPSVRFVIGLLILSATIGSVHIATSHRNASVKTLDSVDVAARYQLRKRTENFYKRSTSNSSTRTTHRYRG
ncbi:MAG: hypothetical protein KDB03_03200 [Planctomycetales bacterium]|nr:hypothetical protein [Planctomycetales bacterium]